MPIDFDSMDPSELSSTANDQPVNVIQKKDGGDGEFYRPAKDDDFDQHEMAPESEIDLMELELPEEEPEKKAPEVSADVRAEIARLKEGVANGFAWENHAKSLEAKLNEMARENQAMKDALGGRGQQQDPSKKYGWLDDDNMFHEEPGRQSAPDGEMAVQLAELTRTVKELKAQREQDRQRDAEMRQTERVQKAIDSWEKKYGFLDIDPDEVFGKMYRNKGLNEADAVSMIARRRLQKAKDAGVVLKRARQMEPSLSMARQARPSLVQERPVKSMSDFDLLADEYERKGFRRG